MLPDGDNRGNPALEHFHKFCSAADPEVREAVFWKGCDRGKQGAPPSPALGQNESRDRPEKLTNVRWEQ
jgi:hypothetical protein